MIVSWPSQILLTSVRVFEGTFALNSFIEPISIVFLDNLAPSVADKTNFLSFVYKLTAVKTFVVSLFEAAKATWLTDLANSFAFTSTASEVKSNEIYGYSFEGIRYPFSSLPFNWQNQKPY